jgi:prevent-host-death family protein
VLKSPRKEPACAERANLDFAGHLSDTMRMVSFVSTRELSKQPGRVMKKVRLEGPQVITQNGTPAAYLVPASGMGIEADLEALRRVLLGRALDTAQAEAAKAGTSALSMEEIDREIAVVRQARAKRSTTRQRR